MTTKAQAERERIEASKVQAYYDKVKRLTGQCVYNRVSRTEMLEAYNSNITADAFAAEVAYREPVGRCVHPVKAQAIVDARARGEKTVEGAWRALDAAGWDLNKAAPYPESNIGRAAYRLAMAKRQLLSSLTDRLAGQYIRRLLNDPNPVVKDPKGVERFLARCEEEAAFQYDAFTVKLVSKVGEVIEARLEGSHVWGRSFLTVTHADGSVVVWKTQQIVNYSVYGTPYYQWPTRVVKG